MINYKNYLYTFLKITSFFTNNVNLFCFLQKKCYFAFMKRLFSLITTITLITFLLSITLAFASNNIIQTFKAVSNNEKVNIEWRTQSETNVVRFEIERSASGNNFKMIGNKKAKGYATNYTFCDSDTFFKTAPTNELLSKNAITYRLKIVYKDNSYDYSDEVIVTHSMSSVKRTWGMIKEMFK